MCAPRPPRCSPLPVTIRRTVVAGSMTPWVEAAAPLGAPGGRRRRARGRATWRGQGRSAALSPRPAQVPGSPRGEGPWGGGVPGGPRVPLSAAGWPTPRLRPPPHPEPTVAPGTAAGALRRPHARSIFVGVQLLCGFPGTGDPRLCQPALFPAALQEAAETKRSGKLETSEHHRTVPLASEPCAAPEAAAAAEGGRLGWGENLTEKPSCDLLGLPPD